jgi:hypothetical protein
MKGLSCRGNQKLTSTYASNLRRLDGAVIRREDIFSIDKGGCHGFRVFDDNRCFGFLARQTYSNPNGHIAPSRGVRQRPTQQLCVTFRSKFTLNTMIVGVASASKLVAHDGYPDYSSFCFRMCLLRYGFQNYTNSLITQHCNSGAWRDF